MAGLRECDLYGPVKAHMERNGYVVRAEVRQCDVVAVCDDTVIAVEMKLTFGLPVLYQALERLAAADFVYVAVAVPDGARARANWDAQVPAAIRLCRMLGVGLLSVRDGLVVVHADPGAYVPRKQPKSRAKLMGEFSRRSGDHNLGGTTRRPRVTAYREDALRLAEILAAHGSAHGSAFGEAFGEANQGMRVADLRRASGIARAATMLRGNVYAWFEKTGRGIYRVSPAGRDALAQYADVLAAQRSRRQRPAEKAMQTNAGQANAGVVPMTALAC